MNTQNIFIKQNAVDERDNIIYLNLTESTMKGGNLNNSEIHLSLSSTTNNLKMTGGSSETSEYFNKLAQKIVNSKKSMQGGFNVKTIANDSSEIFLSSETINEIKSTNITGGSKKKNLTFNFNDLKKHLLKTTQTADLDGGSDEFDKISEELDDFTKILNDNENTDDDLSDEEQVIKKIFYDETDNEEKEISKISKSHSYPAASRSHNKINKRSTANDDMENTDNESNENDDDEDEDDDDIFVDDDDSDEDENEDKNKNKNKKIEDSISLGGSSTKYEMSDSISSPKLFNFRPLKENTVVGRRFI
jgi:hypothetical protein